MLPSECIRKFQKCVIYNSVCLVGWHIKGTKITTAQGTRQMSPVIPNGTQTGRVVWAMLLAEIKANTLACK